MIRHPMFYTLHRTLRIPSWSLMTSPTPSCTSFFTMCSIIWRGTDRCCLTTSIQAFLLLGERESDHLVGSYMALLFSLVCQDIGRHWLEPIRPFAIRRRQKRTPSSF